MFPMDGSPHENYIPSKPITIQGFKPQKLLQQESWDNVWEKVKKKNSPKQQKSFERALPLDPGSSSPTGESLKRVSGKVLEFTKRECW